VSARNVLQGEVVSVAGAGESRSVAVRTEGVTWTASLTAAALQELALAPGRPVWIAIKAPAFRPLA
jgi:molybdate transport system ATP-binding protein